MKEERTAKETETIKWKKSIEDGIRNTDETLKEIGNELFKNGETMDDYRNDPSLVEKWRYYETEARKYIKGKEEAQAILNKIERGELWIDEPYRAEKKGVTNSEFLKKATVEDMATFFMERTKCEGCFISDFCVKMSPVSDLSCRGMFRAWLEDEAEEKQI